MKRWEGTIFVACEKQTHSSCRIGWPCLASNVDLWVTWGGNLVLPCSSPWPFQTIPKAVSLFRLSSVFLTFVILWFGWVSGPFW